LPVVQPAPDRPDVRDVRDTRAVLTELQALGARWATGDDPGVSRKGGAGPSDHTALVFDGETVMVPIHTRAAERSPYVVRAGATGAVLERDGELLGEVRFPSPPRFYAGVTRDGVPYWKIATLHGTDVLATTVLQHCIRYLDRERACQFCAIGQSLEAGRTVARKAPADLAEVAVAAVALDGVKHMVMTTGTPATPDRGARVLVEAAAAVTARVALPIQAQCEPPADDAWFERLRAAGVVTLGMHLEAVDDEVRRRIMPGKAEIPVARYFDAFARAVAVFGPGQVTSFVLAGLGDTAAAIVQACRRMVALGVYPFVVPFVPIRGTPLEHHPPPSPAFMRALLAEVAAVVRDGGLARDMVRAGCGRCGACSTLAAHEARR
jgi:radical SAM protein (TIGR04043 family)